MGNAAQGGPLPVSLGGTPALPGALWAARWQDDQLQPETNLSGLDISAGIEAEPDGVVVLPAIMLHDNGSPPESSPLPGPTPGRCRPSWHLFTAEARAIALALSALESVTLWPQRQALPGGA